jgi:large subunit ribosomal protein L29
MKVEAMKEWTPEEREGKEREWRQALFSLRLQKATGQLENPMRIREVRRDLARLLTLRTVDAKTKKG